MTDHSGKGRPIPKVAELFRSRIEAEYYGQVSAQATLESVACDAEFLRDPMSHVALYSDHGIAHVRDVVRQVVHVIDTIHGVLIPFRPPVRLDFLRGYGVLLAYLHDIGMRDFSAFGRAMHPEFAAQAVFRRDFDDLVDVIYQENSGNVPWRALSLAARGLAPAPPQLLLRELLAMSVGHSKTKAPIDVLNDPLRLRQAMQRSVATDLHTLYRRQQLAAAERKLSAARSSASRGEEVAALEQAAAGCREALARLEARPAAQRGNPEVERWYEDFERDSFAWLTSGEPALRDLAEDVIDTLRCLRSADALRQRGTTLKTSAGYEVFVCGSTASAIYALRSADTSKLYMIEADQPLNAGEANIVSSELTQEGDLRVAFHRGRFPDDKTIRRAASNAALVINDIQADVIGSFRRPAPSAGQPPPGAETDRQMQILVEHTEDNAGFAPLVCEALRAINPGLGSCSRPAPSLVRVQAEERMRYLAAEPFAGGVGDRRRLREQLASCGLRVDPTVDGDGAFTDVRVVELKAGEVLLESGSPAAFVYVPLGPGLRIIPLGGYRSVSSPPGVAVGVTSVIRGAERNATVLAECNLKLIAIPKEVYLTHWHGTYSPAELTHLLKTTWPGDGQPSAASPGPGRPAWTREAENP